MKPQLFLGTEPKENLMNPIKNRDWGVKAEGGLWTSTYNNGRSEWVNWCENEDFFTTDSRDGWLLIESKNAQIYTVNNYKDLEYLYNKYGMELDSRYPLLDFESIEKDFDAIHLTTKGEWETRFTRPYNFYGWDIESTHWFRWVFDEVKYIGKIEIEVFS